MDFRELSEQSEIKPRKRLWLRFLIAAFVLICILITPGLIEYFLLRPSEKIYIIGGVDQNGKVLDTVQVYDPTNKENVRILPSKLRIARKNHMAGVLENGYIVIAGGEDSEGRTLSSTEFYHPDRGWTHGSNDHVRRKRAAGVVLGNRFYICGGEGDIAHPLSSCEYMNSFGNWAFAEPLKRGLSPASAVAVDDQFFLVGKYPAGSVWVMQYRDGKFRRKTDSIKIGNQSLAMTTLDDLFVVCGDHKDSGEPVCRQMKQKSLLYTQWEPMLTPRLHVSLVNYRGTVFALGGAVQGNGSSASSEVESYFVEDGKWVREIPLTSARSQAAVVVC